MAVKKTEKTNEITVKSAFGAKNRLRLIDNYFAEHSSASITPSQAWAHVYRLLLWIDQTTGLAHCYESDKSQPGKRWYARSLSFHDWVSSSLQVPPTELDTHIDWLFRHATRDLAAEVARRASQVAAAAEQQRAPYKGKGFPKPGEDPELVNIIRETLGDHLDKELPDDVWRRLVQQIRQYLALDNKRKNLVGEGFEDVLAQVVGRTCGGNRLKVHTRKILHELPGFSRTKRGEKPNKVDLAVICPSMRTLVTAKWSVRADREKQFAAEFGEYVNAESDSKSFEYVFVTNEFDPARLMRACEKLAGNAQMFTHVVHINPDAIRATYGDSQDPTIKKVLQFIDNGRLIGLEQWLTTLCAR